MLLGKGCTPDRPWGAAGVPAHPLLPALPAWVAFYFGENTSLSDDLWFPEPHWGLMRGCLGSDEFSK